MSIQPSQERDGGDFSWRDRLLAYVFPVIYSRTTGHPGRAVATEAQKNFVLTAFILGALSVVTAFFPICGLPIAISGLVMGLASRRIAALHTLATWGLALSLVGLVLTLINVIISISIYLTGYLWA